ncbi:MAG: flagellar export protein FliJ [Pirellulaceae bacterium]
MATFHFRLETLLRLRLETRDARRADLVKAQRAEQALEAQGDELAQERQSTDERSRRLAAPGTADIDALIGSHRYQLALKARTEHLANQLLQVQAEVQKRRQALVEADREVRVLEKLREKQHAAQRVREERLQQKQLDEQATIGFTRREASA